MSVERSGPTGRIAMGVAAVLLVALSMPRVARAGQGSPTEDADRLLKGTIDIHVHSEPDNVPRIRDGIELAQLARARGMRGIVLKNHLDPTSGLAFLARKGAPGLEVFGGVDLNLTVGGMNPAAVEHVGTVSGGYGKVVWMSTTDSEDGARLAKDNRPFVRVARDGVLVPEAKAVIAAIVKNHLVMATGHTSAVEALMLLREGRAQGLTRMVVTHALKDSPNMSVAQMQEAGSLGAYLEFAGGTTTRPEDPAKLDQHADVIRKVGVEHCILSSDLGGRNTPLPTDGYAAYLLALRARGFTETELGRMSRENPARLLGLQ